MLFSVKAFSLKLLDRSSGHSDIKIKAVCVLKLHIQLLRVVSSLEVLGATLIMVLYPKDQAASYFLWL